jgi:glycosyltransferase involved in cell wall biosynthesis
MNKKIAAMTVCYNEESTIAFTVSSCLSIFDLTVVIDTGSTDYTTDLIETIFAEDILNGKLILVEIGRLKDWDISVARNKALEIIRENNCDYFIKADGDEVFYFRDGIDIYNLVDTVFPNATTINLLHNELYQDSAKTTTDWLSKVKFDTSCNGTAGSFWKMTKGIYEQTKIFKVEGAISMGKWTDEAKGLPAEGIRYSYNPSSAHIYDKPYSAHYGWARPVDKKIEKAKVWRGPDGNNKGIEVEDRINNLFKTKTRDLVPFADHPEAIYEQIDIVINFFKLRGVEIESI